MKSLVRVTIYNKDSCISLSDNFNKLELTLIKLCFLYNLLLLYQIEQHSLGLGWIYRELITLRLRICCSQCSYCCCGVCGSGK